jgi:Replication-relaxation
MKRGTAMIQAPGRRAGPARLTDDGGAIAAGPVAAACEASDYLYARSRELGPRPDGLGVWPQDGTDIAFLLEYDTCAEHLPQLTAKLNGYAEHACLSTQFKMPILFCFPTPRREQSARKAFAATGASLYLQVATAVLSSRVTCPACDPAWLPLYGGRAPMRLIDLGDVLPDPWRTEPEHDQQDQHELDPAETGWDEVEPDRL